MAMANEIARPRPCGHVLRDLGLVTILLEFCAEQRNQHGGLRADVTRGDIAARAGLTIDRVDDCNRILERCGILEVSRRRSHRGGRNLANVYEIHEAPSPKIEGGEPEPAGRTNRTHRAENEDRQGGGPGPAAPHTRTARAESQDRQGGKSADLIWRARCQVGVVDFSHFALGSSGVWSAGWVAVRLLCATRGQTDMRGFGCAAGPWFVVGSRCLGSSVAGPGAGCS